MTDHMIRFPDGWAYVADTPERLIEMIAGGWNPEQPDDVCKVLARRAMIEPPAEGEALPEFLARLDAAGLLVYERRNNEQ